MLNPVVLLPGARAVLGRQAGVLPACSPPGAGPATHAGAEDRNRRGKRKIIPSLPATEDSFLLFHTLFLTCLVEFIYLFYGHASYKLWHGKKVRNFLFCF